MAKKPSKPIYLGWRKLIDPETNQPRLALVACDSTARDQLAERGYKSGDRVRCELQMPRDYGQLKFAHKVGTLAKTQLPGFEKLDTHDCVKKLQQDAEVCCDITTADVPGLGRMQFVKPQSMAFDKMLEEDFTMLRKGICEHIREKYWPDLSAEQIEVMIDEMD